MCYIEHIYETKTNLDDDLHHIKTPRINGNNHLGDSMVKDMNAGSATLLVGIFSNALRIPSPISPVLPVHYLPLKMKKSTNRSETNKTVIILDSQCPPPINTADFKRSKKTHLPRDRPLPIPIRCSLSSSPGEEKKSKEQKLGF